MAALFFLTRLHHAPYKLNCKYNLSLLTFTRVSVNPCAPLAFAVQSWYMDFSLLPWDLITPAITGIFGVIVAQVFNVGKNKADAAGVFTGSTLKFAESIQNRLTVVEEQLNKERVIAEQLEDERDTLKELLAESNERIQLLESRVITLERKVKEHTELLEQKDNELRTERQKNITLREEIKRLRASGGLGA